MQTPNAQHMPSMDEVAIAFNSNYMPPQIQKKKNDVSYMYAIFSKLASFEYPVKH